MVLILATILLSICIGLGGAVAGAILGAGGDSRRLDLWMTYIEPTLIGIGLVITVLSLWGWMDFTVPKEGRAESVGDDDRARRLIRITVVLSVILSIVSSALDYLAPHRPMMTGKGAQPAPFGAREAVTTLVALALFAVQFFAKMEYLQDLARRLPSRKLEQTSRKYVWLLPVLAVPGVLLIGLGPLIALVLYYNLLNEFRKNLRVQRFRARALRDRVTT